jgi:hypothetical protein
VPSILTCAALPSTRVCCCVMPVFTGARHPAAGHAGSRQHHPVLKCSGCSGQRSYRGQLPLGGSSTAVKVSV